MRHALVSVLCAIALTAQAGPPVLISPVSVAITVGKWVLKDRIEAYYVRVEAYGLDEADARDQAFRLAVNQAVGSLLLSETEIRNRNLVRHDITNYSSGYVHDFKVISKEPADKGINIVVDVWVRKSQLADRLLHESKQTAQVDGGRIAEQVASIQRQRNTGDRVLQTVLLDYPHRAFDIETGLTRVELDQSRRAILTVPIRVSWNSKYVEVLGEAVKNINQVNNCDQWYNRCQVFSTVRVAGVNGYFDDARAYNILHKELLISRPKIRLMIIDTDGNVAVDRCYSLRELDQSNWAPWNFVDVGNMNVSINAGRKKDFGIPVDLSSVASQALDKTVVQVVRQNQCKSIGVL
jgi:hypothetical protein